MGSEIRELNKTKKHLPIYLLLPIQFIEITSLMISYPHAILIHNNWLRVSDIIINSPESLIKTLQKIWFARMTRRVLSLILRTPLRSEVIKLVNNELCLPKTGCVIVIPHSPWAKLLAEWCRLNRFALVFAGGPWIKRTEQVNVPGSGIMGIRKLISHLSSNKFAVIIGDNENRSRCCNVTYLGQKRKATLIPIRIAAMAKVPIVTVVPNFLNRMVNLREDIVIDFQDIINDEKLALQNIFTSFENQIYLSPSLFNPFIMGSLNS